MATPRYVCAVLVQHLENGLQHTDDRAVRAVFAFGEPAQSVEVTEEFVSAVDKMDDHLSQGYGLRRGEAETLVERRVANDLW